MLDLGFEPPVREVMWNLPKNHQTLLFSATIPVEIEAFAQEYFTDPVRVKVGKVSSLTANVGQNLEMFPQNEKIEEVHLHLNVDLRVASDFSPALAPIESFTELTS